MSGDDFVYIVESDAFIRQKLVSFFENFGVDAPARVAAEAPKGDSSNRLIKLDEQEVLRAGRLLDRVIEMRGSKAACAALIPIGSDYMLDMQQSALTPQRGGGAVRLTEKEAHLLQILQAQGGQSVSRDVLLAEVWDYAESVETHTLETHIYRLRQKIESDPSSPQILMTDDAGGYFLANAF